MNRAVLQRARPWQQTPLIVGQRRYSCWRPRAPPVPALKPGRRRPGRSGNPIPGRFLLVDTAVQLPISQILSREDPLSNWQGRPLRQSPGSAHLDSPAFGFLGWPLMRSEAGAHPLFACRHFFLQGPHFGLQHRGTLELYPPCPKMLGGHQAGCSVFQRAGPGSREVSMIQWWLRATSLHS